MSDNENGFSVTQHYLDVEKDQLFGLLGGPDGYSQLCSC